MFQIISSIEVSPNSQVDSSLAQEAQPPFLSHAEEAKPSARSSRDTFRKLKTETATQGNLQRLMALPPQYQMQREIEAIRKDLRFIEMFSEKEEITIKKSGEKEYRVKGKEKELLVQVEYLPMKLMGPKQFTLHFHPTNSAL
ncbi:MAG: hypothetical protein HYZ51_04585 [Candidatus Doudnabacteria bacterium]|nr:hypothetical protein [Candidatus Doudnabacteria bacterium]